MFLSEPALGRGPWCFGRGRHTRTGAVYKCNGKMGVESRKVETAAACFLLFFYSHSIGPVQNIIEGNEDLPASAGLLVQLSYIHSGHV